MPSLKSNEIKDENNDLPVFNKSLTKELVIKGTSLDKINALCDLIRNHPKRQIEYLDKLLNICSKKGRRECIPAIERTKNTFINVLHDKKTNRFNENEEMHMQISQRYSIFINHIKSLLNDHLPKVRAKMCGILFDLMKEIPTNQKLLLMELINRFGDNENYVSAHVSLLFIKHLKQHVEFTAPLVHEVCLFLGRPNLSFKAKYYCICFLNQIYLSSDLHDVANLLCQVYFSMFDSLKSDDDLKHKMLQALLTGLNRAIPYTTNLSSKISEKIDPIFKMVHTSSFPLAVQALVMLFHIKDEKPEINDRFYNALYAILPQYSMHTSNRGIMLFLNLLYKSIAQDSCNDRRKAFVKRLAQIVLHSSPEFTCASILMLSEVFSGTRSFIKLLNYENINGDDDFSGKSTANTGSWVFNSIGKSAVNTDCYLPYHVNPKYCGAQMTSVWEFSAMMRHYHLSVQPFTKKLTDSSLSYEGDPLVDFTHARFIDRFTQRSAKEKPKTPNKMSRQFYMVSSMSNGAPTQDILNKNESELTPEEKLFYKYFKTKVIQETKVIKNSKSKNNDDSDFLSDEEMFDSTLATSRKSKSDNSTKIDLDDMSDLSDDSVFINSEDEEEDEPIVVSKKLKRMVGKKSKKSKNSK